MQFQKQDCLWLLLLRPPTFVLKWLGDNDGETNVGWW